MIIKALLIFCFGVFALVAVYALLGAILATLKIIFRAIVPALISLLVGMTIFLVLGDESFAVVIGLASLVLAVPFTLKWQRPTTETSTMRAGEVGDVRKDPVPEIGVPISENRTPSAWPRKDKKVAIDWEKIATVCPASRTDLNIARDHCARLLRYSRSGRKSTRFEIEEQAMLIRKHVPALATELDDFTALSDDAAAMPWREECAANLISIGERCNELLAEERERSNDTLTVRTSHLRGRLGSPLDRNEDI